VTRRRAKTRRGIQTQPPQSYQLKISLRRSKPLIWRRILVASSTPLDLLHLVLQRTMGWTNVHLHDFLIDGDYFGDPSVDNILGFKNECDFTLNELITERRQTFIYEYDFGDDWEHEVVLEKIDPMSARVQYPVCMAGARACPPEECGGIRGYERLLAILRTKGHPEYESTRKWFGGDFDPGEFNLKWTNKQLAELHGITRKKRA
jgi:hypothetical protein